MTITYWKKYIEILGDEIPSQGMATFKARYDLASDLSGFELKDGSETLSRAYSLITKVGLSYTALEYLEDHLGVHTHPPIFASDLAAQSRDILPSDLEFFTRRMNIHPLLLTRLVATQAINSSNDIRPIVETLRHALFHGSFTPAGWKIGDTKKSQTWLEGLSQVTLRQADETFTSWFESQASGKLIS
jgi:hypothetical protein